MKNGAAVKCERSPEEIRERNAMIRGMVCRILCIAVFAATLIVTWTTAWQVSSHLLDSDASSELILAEKLSREGGIISPTWIYSTELEVLNIQIVYSLLFHLTSDWSLVRFLGTVILHCLMLGAYAYLARQTRMKTNAFLLTASAMLMPFSVPYGRIVLYHTLYIAYAITTMWIVGLYLSSLRKIRSLRSRKLGGAKIQAQDTLLTILPVALLALAAFVSGLGGMRMLMLSAAPLAATSLLWAMTGENGSDESRPFLLPVGLALGTAVCCAAGYYVNSTVLAKTYQFASYGSQTISLVSVNGLEQIFRGLLVSLGYQDSLPLFEIRGLQSVGAAVVLLLVIILSLHTLRHTKDPYARFIQIYMLMGLLVITCVFVFLAAGEWLYSLYYLPLIFWILPALGKMEIECPPDNGLPKVQPEEKQKKSHPHGKIPAMLFPGSTGAPTAMGRFLGVGDPPITAHGLLSLLCCAILILSGCVYTGFFRDPSSMADSVDYTGLNYTDPFTVKGLQPIADYLKEEGYTLCYGDYWQTAVITELTDGQVKSVPIERGTRRKVITYMKWLVDTNLWDPEYCRQQKVCMLLDEETYQTLQGEEKLISKMVEKEAPGAYYIMELTDPAAVAEYLD